MLGCAFNLNSMNKPPIIGITTSNDNTRQGLPASILLKAYSKAIVVAEGIPLLIPAGLPESSIHLLADSLDGFLFSGGGDISAERYNRIPLPSDERVDKERDQEEIYLINKVIQNGKPFLGICRGLQLLNVVMGGNLIMDIATQKKDAIKHDYYPDIPRTYLAHEVQLAGDSRLAGILGKPVIKVNSLHHQGVDQLGKSLFPAGKATDGLIEALELPDHPFGLAVQWHPEWLIHLVEMERLFRAFIEAAGRI